ncbi:MAG: 2-amino-4-hydroxy-6-hydroxymethyldihydropteridine diphosphokinase [Anaerovibrio sp.]|uniref:2-amino-4-hydroxy-6- hydroxymethyldihydropteridine diphosphokinase n=1 Tax=Anaerovibrio sp. TaxID=1872532 RepID=UPI0025DC7125|nr:2-amino-4-hydroxy-6-hydroxymethyldihydropteridine diphosphokinase [Anaerovibrio sp.]MCR5176330.1 2-amino-4-hydroxy-6-hydroxymethyldihydropteridine diphosphokinase [Anaerovibrio sp.]
MLGTYDCYISIGSNIGDKEANIKAAVNQLAASDKIQLISVSSLYRTPPWGNTEQPFFLNGALLVRTSLKPHDLLSLCQDIERGLGRVRHEHWGPRTIDLDLLYIEGIKVRLPELVIPHPYMLERSFVLVPLQEIAPELMINGRGISEYLDILSDRDEIVKVSNTGPVFFV